MQAHSIIMDTAPAKRKSSETEQQFRAMLGKGKTPYRRTGFPDFAILDGPQGVPVGFVEVKRGPNDKRRYDQIAFERFCERYEVPYFLWWPGRELPEWLTQRMDGSGGDPIGQRMSVLRSGETAGIPRKRAPRRNR